MLMHGRIDRACRNLLNGRHEQPAGENGIAGQMRHGRMCAGSRESDLELSRSGHDGAIMDNEGSRPQAGPVVQAEDALDWETAKEAVVQHLQGAAIALFGRLEEQVDRTAELPGTGKVKRRVSLTVRTTSTGQGA